MKSFLQGKRALSVPSLRPATGLAQQAALSSDPARPPSHAPSHAHATGSRAATVEVVKEGDKVVRLVVTCVCGERVEVECLYPAVG